MMPDGSWIRIENLKDILDNFRPVIYHPDDPRYITLWRELKARCTNGIWVPQFNGYRFVPGRLGFFGVFGRFYAWSDKKERIITTPSVRDLEWHRAYYRTEADGFSGFSDDNDYTSDEAIFTASPKHRNNLEEKRWLGLFKDNGKFKEYLKPRENLFRIHEDGDKGYPLYHNESKNLTELGSRGSGKDLEAETVVHTKEGKVKIKDVQVGDKIYGADGKLTTVISKRIYNNQLQYKVTFADGRSIECGGGHLWTLIKNNGKKVTLELNNIKNNYLGYERKNGKRDVKYYVQQNEALDYPEKELPIDPYFLGVWLGDGNSHNTGITTEDEEIKDLCYKIAKEYDLHVQVNQNKSKTCPTYNINGVNRKGANRLKNQLRELNLLHNKHIPEVYLYSSIEQRLELLKGLMDSDGFCDDRSIEFTQKSEVLTNNVCELCRSLGIKVKRSSRIINDTEYHRLAISSKTPIFKLQRKQRYWKYLETGTEYQKKYRNLKASKNAIVKIEPTSVKPSVCIGVDNKDSLFIAGDYIVTHNSYWTALGDILADICMDGAKYFDPDNPVVITRAEIEVTCGGNDKSSELLDKVKFGLDCLANPSFPELGVWKYNEDEIEPCPFWKQMTGSLSTNNKGNPWINEYPVKVGNRWVDKGNRDVVYNTQYAANSKAAAQKSAGGRRTFVVHEEFGLNTEIESAWGSNEGMVTDDGSKKAAQKAIGTSGNMETIVGAKKIMNNPRAFSCLAFKYGEVETGFFLPTYIADSTFKDENGNTDVEAARLKALKIREKKAESNEASVYLEHIMNYPIYIEDMWVQGQGNLLPALEAEAREREILKDNLYKELGTQIELFWDNVQPRGINYRIHKEAVPFYEYPFEPNRTTKETVFTMFIHPSKLEVHGNIPNDAIFLVHDPYVSDEMDKGGSIGAAYFVVNPKYIKDGLPGNCIAASLLGKAPGGVDDYNRMLELGLHFYGNPIGGLWYEANRGDKLRSYFLRKKKLNLLCLRPQFEQGQYIYLRNVSQTGYMASGQSRIFMIDAFSDWLLEDTELTIDGVTETKKNIQRIPCMFLLKQIKLYNKEENFDAVDAMQGLPLAIGEQRHRVESKLEKNSFNIIGSYLKERKYARR